MKLEEAIKSGKPFKHKNQSWYFRAPPRYMRDAISDDWEVVEEVPENQKQMEKIEEELRFDIGLRNKG